MKHTVSREIGGRTISIETGEVAKQASGSVIVRSGDCAVMCAVTFGEPPKHIDFFPLTVDYREFAYAAGRIPGGFFKREGRPTTKETLTARLIDRPIRPLFPDGYRQDVSVVVAVLSADKENDPDVLGMIAAFAALQISEVPFQGPIGAVRIGLKDEQFLVNPNYEDRDEGELDLVLAGSKDALVMVEAGAREVPEAMMLDALEQGHNVIRDVIGLVEELQAVAGKEKTSFSAPVVNEPLKAQVHDLAYARIREATKTKGKHNRKKAVDLIVGEVIEQLCPEDQIEAGTCPDPKEVKSLLGGVKKQSERDIILEDGQRSDGRAFDEIRDITTQLAFLPCSHGSAVFTRGETQSLVNVTLGTSFDEQRIDGLREDRREHFILHYNFPAYCVGESWPNRGPKRREIGHGALAERALRPVLPVHDDFPYTIRIVSDITESNGSSSMATVCGGTLAMMDAGVQIQRPVAGIAMGLVKEGDQFHVLSDILGSEDASGDMDFKVTGTQNGITALQMDIKIDGLSRELLGTALEQAREGRLHILREMLKEIQRPREDVSPHAPKIMRIKINPEKIGIVIGPSGKMIKSIQEETGAKIEIVDDGTVTIWGANFESAKEARDRVEMLTEEVKEGQTYEGRVVSIKDFGCFVEVLPGQEGLLHISEFGGDFVENVNDVVSRGDMIKVKVLALDPQGRIRLSRRALLEDVGVLEPSTGGGDDHRPPRRDGPPRGRGGGDRDRDRGPRGGGGYRGGRDRDRGGRGPRDRDRRDRRD